MLVGIGVILMGAGLGMVGKYFAEVKIFEKYFAEVEISERISSRVGR
jgi:hypothetical protein